MRSKSKQGTRNSAAVALASDPMVTLEKTNVAARLKRLKTLTFVEQRGSHVFKIFKPAPSKLADHLQASPNKPKMHRIECRNKQRQRAHSIGRARRQNVMLPVLLVVSLYTTMLLTVCSASSSSFFKNDPRLDMRGGSTTTGNDTPLMRVAYQGEPGAYSEKATRELLGQKVTAVGRPSFEDCFRAVASMECDYACLPIENSLGGSIHENYDLMLRYDLTIVAEHEFRVHHCLLAKPGVKREQIKYAISHPQALAQCDNFLRGLGITPVPTYDTAGSAKMIAEGRLPDKCTPENTAAIASDLAGRTYGLNCLDVGIEDDDTNFTRFLLLARKGVVEFLTKKIPAKTSVVFTLPNTAGALYKAMACFALRDIDFSKIESRPTSASLLNFLKFKSQQAGRKSRNQADLPRFRYCFYMDFLANQLDETTQNALAHLREQADFMRILGSYPQKSRLVGPVAQTVERLKHMTVDLNEVSIKTLPSDLEDTKPLNIGIVGFDGFGQFLAKAFSKKHRITCLDEKDKVRSASACLSATSMSYRAIPCNPC